MSERTDTEKLDAIRKLPHVHPRCGEVSYYRADDIDEIINPPKPEPKGVIHPENLPEPGTVYKHKTQDARTIWRVGVDTGRIAYFWEGDSRFGTAVTSISNWNYAFAPGVTAVHKPEKPERAKVVLQRVPSSNAVRMCIEGVSELLPTQRPLDSFAEDLRDLLQLPTDDDGNPLIKVIIG